MLTYMVLTTEDLISAAVILGLAFGWIMHYAKEHEHPASVTLIGAIASLCASFLMTYLKNATSLIDTGLWNLRIFTAFIIAFIVLLVLSIEPIKKKTKWAGLFIVKLMTAVIVFAAVIYVLPDVMGYTYEWLVTEKSMFTTGFLFNIIGWIFGLILVFVAASALYKCALKLPFGIVSIIFKIVLLINSIRFIGSGISVMLAKRIIESNHVLFVFASFSANYISIYLFGTIIAAAILPVILIIRSIKVTDPYKNPAELRKIIKGMKVSKRWSVAFLVCFVLVLVNVTAVKAYNNQEVELSPVEDSILEDDCVKVPLEQVDDGHLHRFAYYTEEGTEIRFIVIKKPDSSAYGIGLDACDICGETGYYEKDGMVVCKLCDVVMNINTIGFKGGCNPIVIDYTIGDGYITVPIEGLLEYEDEFK